jgi:hypothetical protein
VYFPTLPQKQVFGKQPTFRKAATIFLPMARNTSQHILNTSATLLGFCLFVITSFHITNGSQASIIDEFTALIAVLLSSSSIFSFFSIRTRNPIATQKFETIADLFFMASLVGILLIILFITFKLIR